MSLTYSSSETGSSSLVGNGWTLNIPQDFITVDQKQSIFPEDFDYYIMLSSSNMEKLKRKSTPVGAPTHIEYFLLEDTPEIEISYNTQTEQWIVESEKMKAIYGRSLYPEIVGDAFQTSLHWPAWRGPGRSVAALESHVSSWYLVSREVKKGGKYKLFYEYEIESKTIQDSQQVYTSSIQLKSIFDFGGQNRIDLILGPKEREEFAIQNYQDFQGEIEFPTFLQSKYYLAGYKFETGNFQQNFNFEYEQVDKIRLLKGFNQEFYGNVETIFSCSYETLDGASFLTELHRDSDFSMKYSYNTLQVPNLELSPARVDTVTKMQLSESADFTAIAYDINSGGVVLQIYTKSMVSQVAHFRPAGNSNRKLKHFALITFPNMVCIFEESESDKKLMIYTRNLETGDWGMAETETYATSAVFRYTDKLVIVSATTTQVTIYEPILDNDDTNEVYRKQEVALKKTLKRLAVQGKIILGYTGSDLFLVKWNGSDWIESNSIATIPSREDEFINSFEINSEHITGFLDQWKIMGLQMARNMIMLPTIEWEGGRVTSKVHQILLDPNLNIWKREAFTVKQQTILSLRKENEQDGDTFYFKYEDIGGRYVVRLWDIRGKIQRDFFDKCKEEGCEEAYKEFLAATIKSFNEENKSIKEMIMFEIDPLIQFELDMYHSKTNSTKILMNGGGWTQTPLPKENRYEHKLGNDFLMEQVDNDDTKEKFIKVFKQNPENGGPTGVLLASFKVTESGSMAVGYPSYIAYQEDKLSAPKIIPLSPQGVGETISLGPYEDLLVKSNSKMIYTIENNLDPGAFPLNMTLVARRVNSVVPAQPFQVVSLAQVQSGDEVRTRTYENQYRVNAGTLSMENTVTMIPTGNKTYSGYYEDISIIPIDEPEKSKIIQNWVNGEGEVVETKIVDMAAEEPEEEKEKENDSMKFFDVSGEYEIANISPYNSTEKMVSYIGFESYEMSADWSFEGKNVVHDGISLTGKSYLKLMDGGKLEGSLIPKMQQTEVFLASCWVRQGEEEPLYEYEAPLDHVKAVVKLNEEEVAIFYGQMKRKLKNWVYVEAIIDFEKVRSNIYQQQHNNLPRQNITMFELNFIIEGPGRTTGGIDVDHARIFPIDFDLNVKVYNEKSTMVSEIILPNGSILRKIYNKYNGEIASTDEEGMVEQLTSGSKSGHIFPGPFQSSLYAAKRIKDELVIRPEVSSYEQFDKYSMYQNWVIDEELASEFQFSRNRLAHIGSSTANLMAQASNLFDTNSAAIRLSYELDCLGSSFSMSINDHGSTPLVSLTRNTENSASLSGTFLSESFNVPFSGELILFIENNRFWLWLDGVLLVDQGFPQNVSTPWEDFAMEFTGQVEIWDLIILNKPQVIVEYFNSWGQRTQSVQLESENTALVTEKIYDRIGRESMKTKTTRVNRSGTRSIAQPLLYFYHDFVTNRHSVEDNNTVDGQLQGLVQELNPDDEGFAYSSTVFESDLLRSPKSEGLPGKDYSAAGPYHKEHSRKSGIPFMTNLFPPRNGFQEKVTHKPNGNMEVSILDGKKNEIAKYIKAPGYNHLLTTYQYDKQGRMLKILPPAYHEKVGTYGRTEAWPTDDSGFDDEELQWQRTLGTIFEYNEDGQLIRKSTPDTGIKEYMYDNFGNIKFMYSVDPGNNTADNIVYMMNSGNYKPVEIGFLPNSMPIGELQNYKNGTDVPDHSVYQRIVYSDTHSDPEMRGKAKLFMTYDNGDKIGVASRQDPPVHEELVRFNSQEKVVLKTWNNLQRNDVQKNLHKIYKGGKVAEILYPVTGEDEETTNILQNHDKVGRLTEIKSRRGETSFAKFAHSASGQVVAEQIEAGTDHELNRMFAYTSPGHLTHVSDENLSENIYFTQKGYGQQGAGDGVITQTSFGATWANTLDDEQKEWFRIPVEYYQDLTMRKCWAALERLNFTDSIPVPLKPLTLPDLDLLPTLCTGPTGVQLMSLVAQYLPPSGNYGHQYAYGSHLELTTAKFTTDGGSPCSGPLQINSFIEEIPSVETEQEAQAIFDALGDNMYITVLSENRDDKSSLIGKKGLSGIFRDGELYDDLRGIESEVPDAHQFTDQIIKMQFNRIVNNQEKISVEEFSEKIVEWLSYEDYPTANAFKNRARRAGALFYAMMEEKNYLSGDIIDILRPTFVDKMEQFKDKLPEIVKVIQSHFNCEVGQDIFDLESSSIDANGNRLKFEAGLDKYEMEYEENCNKIKSLKIIDHYYRTKTYQIGHDSQGNVNKAEHQNISWIKYHPVTNRPLTIELTDGRILTFKYDAQGERIRKRVFSPEEQLLSEVEYLRDERGDVMMDTRTKYTDTGKETVKTTYLYGPMGLLGFIRHGKFFSVFTDHAGSVRLVTQGGKVVAGYDYLPYGEHLRKYGSEEGHIFYRFTGQEYDEEIGLYNFHARLYDPKLGRFYQPDPKAQYYSPYIYGGNSPVSMVDPDGEFFFTLFLIASIIIGAYLGAAAANGKWNPLKWDFTSMGTWTGLIMGAIAGATLPATLASINVLLIAPAILVGLGTAYLTTAASAGSWNPAKWDWSNPQTYNSLFTGFVDGVGTFKSVTSYGKNFMSLTRTGQLKAIGKLVTKGIGAGVVFGLQNGNNFKFWSWDWKDPATWVGLIDGFKKPSKYAKNEMKDVAMEKYYEMSSDPVKMQMMMDVLNPSIKFLVKNVMKDKTHPMYESVGEGMIANAMSTGERIGGSVSVSKELITADWNSLSTFESVLNMLLKGTETVNMLYEYRTGNNIKGTGESQARVNEAMSLLSEEMAKLASGYLTSTETTSFPKSKNHNDFTPFPQKLSSENLNILEESLNEFLSQNAEDILAKFEREQSNIAEFLSGLRGGNKVYLGGNFDFLECKQNVTSDQLTFSLCDIGPKQNFLKEKENILQEHFTRDNFILFLKELTNQFQSLSISSDELIFLIQSFYNSFSKEFGGKLYMEHESAENQPELNILHVAFLQDKKVFLKTIVASDISSGSPFSQRAPETNKFDICYLKEFFGDEVEEVEKETLFIPISLHSPGLMPVEVLNNTIMKEEHLCKNDVMPETNFRHRFARSAEFEEKTTSGASSNFGLSPINMLRNFGNSLSQGFSSISQFLYGTNDLPIPATQFNETKFNQAIPDEGVFHKIPEKLYEDSTHNCQLGAWLDGEYSMDGITCFQEGSRVSVFRTIDQNDIEIKAEGNEPPKLYSDTFKASSCRPVEFNGIPSVACEGEKTTFVYTPYHQERIFDNLDGNIMLGRIFVHLGGKMLWSGENTQGDTPDESVNVSQDTYVTWEKQLREIENLIAQVQTQNDVKWAQVMVQECRTTLNEMLENNKGKLNKIEVEIFNEQLSALLEDIQEQVAAGSSKQAGTDSFNESQNFSNGFPSTGYGISNPNGPTFSMFSMPSLTGMTHAKLE